MADIISALMKMLGQGGGPPPPLPINEAKPWETPGAGAGALPPGGPPPPPGPPPPLPDPALQAVGATNPAGPASGIDDALMQALKQLQMRQAFAQGTGNPVPR